MDNQRIEQLKANALQKTRQDDIEADKISIHGERVFIELKDRTIKTAFYPAKKRNAPILFAFHGGSFIFGSYTSDDCMYDRLRNMLGVNVVSVGYRRAPEFQFPMGVYDCYDAMKYYLEKSEYDFDSSKIIVYGSSAGANLASAMSILSNRRKEFRVSMQILNYPVTDMTNESWQYKKTTENQAEFNSLNALIYASKENLYDPLVSPVFSSESDYDKDLISVFTMSENDSLGLCYEGILLANILRSRGMKVYTRIAENRGHGFFEFSFKIEKARIKNPSMISEADLQKLIEQREKTLDFIANAYKSLFE